MSYRITSFMFVLPCFLILTGSSLGQDKENPPPPKIANKDGQTGTNDPTVPSPKLKEILTAGQKAGMSPKLPSVILRGRVISKSQPAVAVLEVEGKTYTVGKGSLIPGGVYRVMEVNSLEIIIEVGPLKENMVLR